MTRLLFAAAAAFVFPVFAQAQVFIKHPTTYQVGPNPTSIVATDLNNDGRPDIVTANPGELNDPRQERPANDELSLLLSSAPLEYAALPPLRADFGPYAVAAANIDGEKGSDIIAASFLAVYNRDITLFRNVGDKVFEPTYFAVPDDALPYNRMLDGDNAPVFTKPGITSMLLTDVNKDGMRDIIATAWCSDSIVYMQGEAKTYFGKPQYTLAASGPRDIAVADFDNDKNLDLAVALYTSGEVGLWRGNGEGIFEPVTRFSSRGKLPSTINVEDINADGKLDIIVSHCHTDDSIVIFYGDGNFQFSMSQEILLDMDRNLLNNEIRDVLVHDFNNDGRPDIAAACFASRQVTVLVHGSSGSSIPQTFNRESYTYDNGRPRALYATDFNNDKATDLAVALWESNSVAILLGAPEKVEPEQKAPAEKKAAPKKKK